jgi:hypothetical protein
MCAMMQKLRVNSIAMEAPLSESAYARSIAMTTLFVPFCSFA